MTGNDISRIAYWDVKTRLSEVYESPGDAWRSGHVADNLQAKIETRLFHNVFWITSGDASSFRRLLDDSVRVAFDQRRPI